MLPQVPYTTVDAIVSVCSPFVSGRTAAAKKPITLKYKCVNESQLDTEGTRLTLRTLRETDRQQRPFLRA